MTDITPIKHKVSVMLATSRHPGWDAVRGQAEAAGFTPNPDEKLHVTVVFFGDSLTPARTDDARAAVLAAMQQTRDKITKHAAGNPLYEGHKPFIPVRFPGTIGINHTRKGSYVKADVEVSGALVAFRKMVLDAYPHKVKMDFGGEYNPHVTLAEGPPGLQLPRAMTVPAGHSNATTVIFKVNGEREIFTF